MERSQTRTIRRWPGVLMTASMFAAIVVALFVRWHVSGVLVGAKVAIVMAGLFVVGQAATARVVIGPQGLTIHNIFWTRNWDWPDVEAFELTWYWRLAVRLRNGRKRWIDSIVSVGWPSSKTAEQLRRLQHELNEERDRWV